MDHEERVPAASIAEVKHWADGEDAVQPSTGADQRPGVIRHSFPVETICYRCGERGGHWHAGSVIQHGSELSLARNQIAGMAADGKSVRIFTHVCADAVNIDMPGVGVVPLAESSSGFAPGRVSAGDGIEVVRPPDPVAGCVHEISLRDRLAVSKPTLVATGRGPDYQPDYRAIAKELLSAVYGMIGHFGMPIKSRELSDEVETALLHAEVAKVDEVLL